MNDPVRTWIPLSAIWIPVWITLDAVGESTDALETAVAGLVRAGLRAPDALARELCLDVALVESGVATLLGAGVLAATDAGLTAAPEPEPVDGPSARPGFVVWDPAGRPLLQLWLDRDLPSAEPPAPSGWRVAAWSEPAERPPGPSGRRVAELLRALPTAGDLRLFEPRGDGVHESDGARVRRLRRRSGPTRTAPVWVPVEHRVAGPVVWRPSLRPLPEVSTELDPAGYDALRPDLLTDRAREALQDADRERRDRIAPGVLRQIGFTSVDDLRQSARDDAARELGGIAALPEWAPLVSLVEDAIVDEHVSRAVGGDWRRPLRAWGDVLERLTELAVASLRPVVEGLRASRPPADELARLRRLLGPTVDLALTTASTPDRLSRLHASLRGELDSIGTRILALGVCAVLHPPTRRALEALAADTPKLFETLDKAKDERNAVVHPKADAEPIGVAGHRARVLLLCRVLPRLGGGFG